MAAVYPTIQPFLSLSLVLAACISLTLSIRFVFTSSEPQYTISISDDLINVTTPDGVNYTRGDLCSIEVQTGSQSDVG